MRRHPLPRRGDRLSAGAEPSSSPLPRWRLVTAPDPGTARTFAASLNLPVPLAALLLQRGVDTTEAARAFLRPELASLTDPGRLFGLDRAVELIASAVARRTPILVHGDYDVDGQCATALLVRTLQAAGADVHGFVPNRLRDGYDFGPAGLREAERVGAGLIVTCDCGITANAAVRTARDAGRQVVITDHHLPGDSLPQADAIIDPQLLGDSSGLAMLCGTGVAFKLAQALAAPLGLPANHAWHLLDLVALATIADVVPLVGENRILVKHGLRVLAQSRWPGVQALLHSSGVDPAELRAGQVGFTVAPRLNAAGRVADAQLGLELLLTDDPTRATEIARQLELLNRERQQLDQEMLDQALRSVDAAYREPEAHRALVLAADGWHAGVVGIVASRVVERFGRPTFLIALDDAVGKGSGRSVERFDLHAALHACGHLLERFGGHRMAAGLTIRRECVAEFREAFNAQATAHLAVAELGPEQRVDLELAAADVSDDLERWGRHLEPCGMGNPAPVFGVRHVRLAGARTVGTNHLKATLASGSTMLDAIAFNWADRAADMSRGDVDVDVAFRLERHAWQGRSSLQARVLALTPTVS